MWQSKFASDPTWLENLQLNASGAIWWPNLQLMQEVPSKGNFATNASGAKFLAGEITRVKESIPWVRCASGNVYWFSWCATVITQQGHCHLFIWGHFQI